MSKICIYVNRNLHLVSTKCKSKIVAYGVKFTHVSKSVHMRQFAYASKFEDTQINTHVSKSVNVYGELLVYHVRYYQQSFLYTYIIKIVLSLKIRERPGD